MFIMNIAIFLEGSSLQNEDTLYASEYQNVLELVLSVLKYELD